jgi:hypothetical protein
VVVSPAHRKANGRSLAKDCRHVIASASVSFLLLLGPACSSGGSGQRVTATDPRTSRTARRDALIFLTSVRAFSPKAQAATDQSLAMILKQERDCRAVLPKRNRALTNRISTLESVFTRALQAKLTAPAYIALSNSLSNVKTDDRALETVARADASVAHEAQKVLGAEIDLCGALRRWRGHRWSETFEQRLMTEPFGPAVHLDGKRLTGASEEAVATLPELRKLGLSLPQATAIAASGRFF